MAKKNYYKKSKAKSKFKKQYSAAEKKSYKRGFFAGLFTTKKKKYIDKPRNKYGKTLDDYPNWAKHNVLFDDNSYRRFLRGAYEMGYEDEKARDIALHLYSKECGDKKLKEHYEIK